MDSNGLQQRIRRTAFGSLPESVKLVAMPKKARLMPFPLRLRPELRKRLEALARAERRALSNYIVVVLERHADAAERKREAETDDE